MNVRVTLTKDELNCLSRILSNIGESVVEMLGSENATVLDEKLTAALRRAKRQDR